MPTAGVTFPIRGSTPARSPAGPEQPERNERTAPRRPHMDIRRYWIAFAVVVAAGFGVVAAYEP
ncbi:MAG: hypothetical protein ACJ79Y_12920, partial [Myxococcales bacterium]